MDLINKEHFVNNYKSKFGKALSENKKKNIFLITDAFEKDDNMKSLRWLAYILATGMHESNDTFEPVTEGYWIKPEAKRVRALYNYYLHNNPRALKSIFPNGYAGKAYYGRGRIVQLTHEFNYRFASLKLYNDMRLVDDPDIIIKDPSADIAITFRGMREGWFTGFKLENFFPLGLAKAEWKNARKIINGLDKAALIAGYAVKFYGLL
ncbi:MAG: hypothetical protein IT280_06375, partial [Ignavibacteria bacterium]|nr:hypothetical protein [Ignavibacteria bacterium]